MRSYAMFTQEAMQAMDLPREAVCQYTTSFEHFGDVTAGVFDLGAAHERQRANRERFFLTEEEGYWTFRWQFDCPPAMLWDALTDAPRLETPQKGVTHPETYELTAHEGGTALRYTLGCATDADGALYPDFDAGAAGFLGEYWPQAFGNLDRLLAERKSAQEAG